MQNCSFLTDWGVLALDFQHKIFRALVPVFDTGNNHSRVQNASNNSYYLRNNLDINSQTFTFDANKYSQRLCGYTKDMIG